MLQETLKSISKKELLFIGGMILLVIVLTAAPYLYGYFKAPADKVFIGGNFLSTSDIFVYYSYIEQAKAGNFIFQDLFTSENQNRVIFNIFWLAVGLAAKVFSLSSFFILQIFRIIFIPILIFTLYFFISFITKDKKQRFWGLLLLLFSSGLGDWLYIYFNGLDYGGGAVNYPIDLWITEANIFLTMSYFAAHFMASLALMIWIFLLMYLALNHNKIKYSLSAGLLALILFNFHPFYIVSIFIILFSYLLVLFFFFNKKLWPLLKHLIVLGLIASPSILYHFYIISFDPITALRASQNLTLTPGLFAVLAGFGLIIFFAVLGIILFWRKYKELDIDQRSKYIFLITWLGVNFILIYFPISFQRRLLEGLEVPMVLLAVFGLVFLFQFLNLGEVPGLRNICKNKVLLLFLFVICFCSTNLSNYSNSYAYSIEEDLYYTDKAKLEALNWLKANGDRDKVVFTDTSNGIYIPAYAGFKTYFGHWAETVFVEDKYERIKWFYKDNKNDEKKLKFLHDNNIGYIFWDSQGDHFSPETKDYLEKIFENSEVEIYKVL